MNEKDIAQEGRDRQEEYYQQQRKALRGEVLEMKKAEIDQGKEQNND